MNGFTDAVFIPGTQLVSSTDIDAGAHANEKSNKQRDQQRSRTHRTQGPVVCKAAYNGHIADVKKHFQKMGKHQGDAEQKNIFKKRTFRHGNTAGRRSGLAARHNKNLRMFGGA